MKFVTVMDMWLLIINLCLMSAILYYGRKLVNLISRAVKEKDKTSLHKERLWFIEQLTSERDNLQHMSTISNSDLYYDEIVMLNDLIDKVKERAKL